MKKSNFVGKRVMAAVLAVMTGFMITPGAAVTARAGEEAEYEEIIFEEPAQQAEDSSFEEQTELEEAEVIEGTEETEETEEVEELLQEEEISFEADLTFGDYRYYLSGEDAVISHYYGKEADVVIPEEIDGHKVVILANDAFKGKSALETVIIPDTVQKIGCGAFRYCSSLRKVQLSKELTSIDQKAFEECTSLSDITLPDKLEYLGTKAFAKDKALIEITIPASLKDTGVDPFEYSVQKMIFAEGMTAIPSQIADDDYYLKEIVIPDTVISIGGYAFRNCQNLEEVVLPDSVTEIKEYAFYGCSKMILPSKRLPENISYIGFGAFDGARAITELTIPKGLTSVGRMAFSSVKTMYFEDGMTAIPANMCAEAKMLSKVVIPDSVTSIGYQGFYNCDCLENIELPERLETIGDWAFASTDKLDNVVIPDSVTNIGNSAFKYCDGLKTLHLPKSLEAVGEGAFEDCGGLESIVLPMGVKFIGRYSFAFCDKLKSIELPEGLEYIGDNVFKYDHALEKVTVPSTVTTMGANIFYDSVKKVEFAQGMKNIPEEACSGADKLTEVIIPEGVETIGKMAFKNCKQLEKVVIPDGATTVGEKAFEGNRLLKVTVPKSLQNIGDKAFDDCTIVQKCGEDLWFEVNLALHSAQVAGTGEIGNSTDNVFGAFISDVKFLELGEGITAVSDHAFEGTTNLKSVVMGDGVKTIGKEAFKDCPNLQRVDFSAGLETIGDSAFSGCAALKNVIFAGDAPVVSETAIPSGRINAVYPAGNKTYNNTWKARFPYMKWETFNNNIPRKDIVLILDTSRPMSDYGRGGNMKESAIYFCEKLGGRLNNVRISIVDAQDFESVVLATNTTDTVREKDAIKSLKIHNSKSSFGEGMEEAYNILAASEAENKAVILFSCGEHKGYEKQEAIYGYGQTFREIGCGTYSVLITPEEEGATNMLLFAGAAQNICFINDIDRFTDIFAGEKVVEDQENDFIAAFTDLAEKPEEGLCFNPENERYEAVFKGEAVTPKVLVTSSQGILKEGTDYTLKYSGNTKLNAKGNPATVTITGKGNYSGKKVLEFYLLQDESEGPKEGTLAVKVEFKASGHVYNGKAQTVTCTTDSEAGELAVTDASGKLLTLGEDFILKYNSNVNVGTAKVTVRGIGEYTGSVTKTFKITPDTASEIEALVDESAPVIYDPKGASPRLNVTVSRGEETQVLKEGKDYVINCKNNKKVGTAKCTVSFLGNFKGHGKIKDIPFTIIPASFKKADIIVPNVAYNYKKAGTYRSKPIISIDGVLLSKNDYDVKYFCGGRELEKKEKITLDVWNEEYSRNIDVVITGKGNYEGDVFYSDYNVILSLAAIDLSKAQIIAKEQNAKGKNVPIKTQQYTGSEVKPEVAVVVTVKGRKVRVPSYMYEVKYLNNVKAGKATVMVVGKGDDTVGKCKTTFTIAAKKIR